MELTKDWFKEKIEKFLTEDQSNKMNGVDGIHIFNPKNFSVGFCDGNDPIFEEYKKIIGKFHLTPEEAYTKFCERNNILCSTENLSVVAYILPINQKTRDENLEYSNEMPSERWAHTRLFGEEANQKLQKFLIKNLKQEGINAVAPMTQGYMFRIHRKHENGVWASTWSHRHMAFAAGLGSFGLSDGFINECGIAMRCGSLIVDYKLPSDAEKRPDDPYYFCTNCGACIERCPVGAISFENRHDKLKCSLHVMSSIPYIKDNYKINIYSCGLCQVGVPCEKGIPAEDR